MTKLTSKVINQELRAQFKPLIQSYWKKIDEFDRKFTETGDVNYKILLDHNKTLVMGVMEHIKSLESKENENGNS